MDVGAVGFDLDETLAGTTLSRSAILASATDRADAPDISREAYLDAHARHSGRDSRRPVFAALLDGRETTATAGDLTAAYRTAVEQALDAVSAVPALVHELRGDHRVGLLTDGPVETQQGKLDVLGWTDLFDETVVTGALSAPKPDWQAFTALAAALDVPTEATVYVGDHPENDIAGAAAAGMTPVQVRYDGGPDVHPAAAATVERDRLAVDLPRLVAEL